jgi:IstB-like ATP binding protein
MNDDLDQLLKNLKMRAMREVVERELARAQKNKVSYAEFYARLLREQYQLQKQRSLEYRIDRAKLPERWALETFPFEAQPGVHEPTVKQLAELDFVAKKENIVFVGPPGPARRARLRPPPQGPGERLPRPLRQGTRSLRRDVRQPRRPLLAQAPEPPDA